MKAKLLVGLTLIVVFALVLIRLNHGPVIVSQGPQAPSKNQSSSAVSANPISSSTAEQTPRSYEYHVNLPNALMLVDAQGRRTGKNPATGVFYHEIPGTGYGEGDRSGQLAVLGLPDGDYKLYILGGKDGPYWINEVTGTIQMGAMDIYALNYKATVNNPKMIFQGMASSTASITTEPPHNLPVQ